MAHLAYDDFRILLTDRADGSYDLVAITAEGGLEHRVFTLPLTTRQIEDTVMAMARVRSRSAHRGRSGGVVTREVDPPPGEPEPHAELLGGVLGDALFANGIGEVYEAARESAARRQRGLRLTLSLAKAPGLLSLPWEFLYRRPRFIASQSNTPLVRRLETGSVAPPPAITDTVRIVGVISSPKDLPPLDVAAERRLVEAAVAKTVAAGRVQLDWLEPATPRHLREALRDNSYHIVHYVGHSSFTDDQQGAIYLCGDDGNAVAVDHTMLANLLANQNSLRLVVLNSCEGARATAGDPYAGVATSLIELGVPAVVAMQFEISDRAAVLFADELYTNLIGRQEPIDGAVAEARKAIYVEVDRVEWATPVLFVRNPEVQLFDFRVPAAELPQTRPEPPARTSPPQQAVPPSGPLTAAADRPSGVPEASGPTPSVAVASAPSADLWTAPTAPQPLTAQPVAPPSPPGRADWAAAGGPPGQSSAAVPRQSFTAPPPPPPSDNRWATFPPATPPRRRRRTPIVVLVLLLLGAATAAALIAKHRADNRAGTSSGQTTTTDAPAGDSSSSDTTVSGGSGSGCTITIVNPLVSITEQPEHGSQEVGKAPPGDYDVTDTTTTSFAGNDERWFRIDVGSRSGWVQDNTILIDSKSSGCP